MRLPRHGGREAMELKMTPMIDVVFLLLVFFIWTSSFELPEYDLPSALAEPPAGISDQPQETTPTETFDELVIAIAGTNEAPAIMLNGTPIPDRATLKLRLEEVVNLGAQPPVIIDPEPELSVGVAVDMYDTARAAGLVRVLFAAEE